VISRWPATLLVLGFGQFAGAREAASAPELRLTVRVYDFVQVPGRQWTEAAKMASLTFQAAGIDLAWMRCSPPCPSASGAGDLELRIVSRAPRETPESNGVIGLALLGPEGNYGTTAYVFFDRVEALAGELAQTTTPGTWGILTGPSWVETWKRLGLGVAMAHELGHLLLGANSHSAEGIMNKVWARYTLLHALGGKSRFTSVQAVQLRKGVTSRLSDLAAFDWLTTAWHDCDPTSDSLRPLSRRSS
jgi:hypothetical protein